jgi:hypothetical protein
MGKAIIKPDVREMYLSALDDMKDKIGDVVSEKLDDALSKAIHEILTDDDTRLDFPISWYGSGDDGWGNGAVEDPLTIYLVAGYGAVDQDQAVYSFNLRDELSGDMESCANDSSHYRGLKKLSAALRLLADEIDETVSVGIAAAKEKGIDIEADE